MDDRLREIERTLEWYWLGTEDSEWLIQQLREARKAMSEVRRLLQLHWSDNPNWRQGQEHTYMGRMDIILQAALGEQP